MKMQASNCNLQTLLQRALPGVLIGSTLAVAQAQPAPGSKLSTVMPVPTPVSVTSPVPAEPATPVQPVAPRAQAYVEAKPPARVLQGHTLVPISFLVDGLGASVTPVDQARNQWRITYFDHVVELYRYQHGARVNGQPVKLPATPRPMANTLYVPWTPLAKLFGIKWSLVKPAAGAKTGPASASKATVSDRTVILLQYPAAYIKSINHSIQPSSVRVVVNLSNATRITTTQHGLDVRFQMAAARVAGVPTVQNINDYLVPRAVTRSGNWKASLDVRMNYAAPVQWFTAGSPPRLVIDVQRLFEESNSNPIGGGLSLTRIRKGTSHGPVQMFVARVDPHKGWRVRVASAGYAVMKRAQPSHIASRHKALVAVNGGFFAYDGAAVGALLVDGEWIRLPWKGRTAIAFKPDGKARIGNLQTDARVEFSSGLRAPIRDLNGWPDKGQITALTQRFNKYYKLRSGEMAVIVKNGKVVSKPGGGGLNVPENGFVLVASGAARPLLEKVRYGETAEMKIQAIGWNGYTSALGGGPRLLNNGRVEVTALREAFRGDVRIGTGPRTAMGIDKQGHYIILVVDGRQNYYSTGLTLTELAYTMQKLGAVDAVNLDGGGSTAMAVRGTVINRPSDGRERGVSNALLVMR